MSQNLRYNTHMKVHILRPGTFTDESGQQVTLTDDDIGDIAATYRPALHEAPVVIGHPKSDDPAWGWVHKLSTDRDGLHAEAGNLDSDFSEMVQDGKFRKVSASLYGPKHPNNPVPGKWHLRHVGFLGAKPPAVKGLRQLSLDDGDGQVLLVETSLADSLVRPWIFGALGRTLRGFREWIIAKDGVEEADKIIHGQVIDDLVAEEERLYKLQQEKASPAMTETEDGGDDMPLTETQLTEKETSLAEKETTLAAREAALAEKEATARKAAIKARVNKHAEAGRILPRQVALVTALAESLAETPVSVSLADAEGNEAEQDLGAAFETFLAELPNQVDYTERAGAGGDNNQPARIRIPSEFTVRETDQHQRVVNYAEENNCSYLDAVHAIGHELTPRASAE